MAISHRTLAVVLLIVASIARISAIHYNGNNNNAASSSGSPMKLESTPSSSPSSTSRSSCLSASTSQGAYQNSRIQEIRQLLCDRHSYVLNGHRLSDFADWVQSQGGETKIFSMHGVDVNFHVDELHAMELAVEVYPLHEKTKDPFLPDRMNLNIPVTFSEAEATALEVPTKSKNNNHTSVAHFYKGAAHDWDDRQPTALQLTLRAMKLSIIFAPVLTTSWLAVLSSKFRREVWYKWVANCLASGGAAFIKYGQWSSTRPDMFPTAFCDALSQLHNSAPAHSWNHTQEQVEASLDIPQGSLLEVFESFDKQPLASGSIAQVHKARLKNGQTVAAKVVHPRVAELIDMDFRLMTMLASVCDWIPGLRWLHVRDTVSQFSHTMAAQAHLNVEAHHLEVLNYNFRNWKHVRFPQPFFASPSLILETYEKGSIVTDILDTYDQEARKHGDLQGSDIIPLDLARFIVTTGLSLYLKMLFLDNVMHADLHPGNIMLDIDYPTDGSGRAPKLGVTLVDAGMVAQLTEEESTTFIGLLCSLGEGDGRAAAEHAMRFSVENNMSQKQRESFIEDMETLFGEKCSGYGTNVNVGDVLTSILGLIRKHHVRIDANYATLVINAMCVESLARRVCPSYNVLEAGRPMLQAYRKMSFAKDGYTRTASSKQFRRMKRVMPFLLDRQKGHHDKTFFKKIELQRNTRKRVARGGDKPKRQ
ncbi:2-octaprenylphenol hydroxylase [Nitzschia inconspicua]|uniref:2-octaprenylphenol hydroxylase n=1 Tax=Nitzschia inconspicua TaxID=303405 RepID=A0A9K3LM85_9STRA|nr:2-octaprenylphenol hydroxylase [Nitzschia inconspicua]